MEEEEEEVEVEVEEEEEKEEKEEVKQYTTNIQYSIYNSHTYILIHTIQ